jgi:hypothetical protein
VNSYIDGKMLDRLFLLSAGFDLEISLDSVDCREGHMKKTKMSLRACVNVKGVCYRNLFFS